jgi:Holliday junction resolvase RusA-like endonuclease
MSEPEFFELSINGLPPSVNKMYANMKWGGRIKSKEAYRWEGLVKGVVFQKLREYLPYLRKQKNRALKLELYFYRPTWHCTTKKLSQQFKKEDISNKIKAIEDSFMKAIGLDDSQIVELIVKKVEDPNAVESTFIRLWVL